ncbi:MAG: hypothetical protein O9264_13260, partial [Leptospira sp.]|nr:hypothetical protein [Leptospira sp.]
MKITTFSVFACMALSIACNPNKDADKDRNGLLMLAFVLDAAQINFKLDKSRVSTQMRATSSELSNLPERFRDGKPTTIVPSKAFSMDIYRILLWKKPELGGVARGKETIANADVTIMDVGAQGTGPEAAGKVSYRVQEENILKRMYAYGDQNGNITTSWTVGNDWKDPTFDRIGIEISQIGFQYEMTYLTSKSNRMIYLETKPVAAPQDEYSNFKKRETVPVDYVVAFPLKKNTDSDTPCTDQTGQAPFSPPYSEILACNGTLYEQFYVDKRTGGPSIANRERFRNNVFRTVNTPTFSDAEWDALSLKALPYPRFPQAILDTMLRWETPANEKIYDHNIWKTERVVLLDLPSGNRKKVNIVL